MEIQTDSSSKPAGRVPALSTILNYSIQEGLPHMPMCQGQSWFPVIFIAIYNFQFQSQEHLGLDDTLYGHFTLKAFWSVVRAESRKKILPASQSAVQLRFTLSPALQGHPLAQQISFEFHREGSNILIMHGSR